jgi:hypothetical protein
VAARHLIGLLLATEDDWPTAFESVLARLGPIRYQGETHEFSTERVKNEPFDLRYVPRYALVIDRLSYWYDVPREWLKKIALMDEVYLLNNPFTFQAMEKHSAYCAMIRLGLKVPETWLIPTKVGPEDERYAPMSERYRPPFQLDEVAKRVGYPLFMKPFDGGGWVGVTRIKDADDLHRSYEESGTRLMHLQASIEDYDVFTRTLSIGPQAMVMRFDPGRPYYGRYLPDRGFAPPQLEWELETVSLLVNAFFRWEFNSCEVIVKDGQAYPIDYANASPDLALRSLNYFFPWAIKALVAWCVFCCLTKRRMRINQATRDFFEIGDRDDLSYEEKLQRYRALADAYFRTEEFVEFEGATLADLEELVVDYVESDEFDELRVRVIRAEEPEELQDEMIERSRSLVAAWTADQRAAARTP